MFAINITGLMGAFESASSINKTLRQYEEIKRKQQNKRTIKHSTAVECSICHCLVDSSLVTNGVCSDCNQTKLIEQKRVDHETTVQRNMQEVSLATEDNTQ